MNWISARNWQSLALRGVIAIIFGILALVWPGITLRALVFLFGIYALIDGIALLFASGHANEQHRSMGWLIFEGIIGILAGLAAFFLPGLTALALLYLIAAWAILTGISEIVQAVELRHAIHNEWLLILSGIASIIFGILLFLFPGTGALTVVWLIGVYAIIFGVLLLGLAFRLRQHTAGHVGGVAFH